MIFFFHFLLQCINNSSSINSEDRMEAAGPSHEVFSMPQLGLIPEVAPIMKPDIVFFGEGLGDEFHNAVADDKDQVDLLIMIGSSLKVKHFIDFEFNFTIF